jgi:hypothetical protein
MNGASKYTRYWIKACSLIQNKRFNSKKNFGCLLSAGPAASNSEKASQQPATTMKDSPLHTKYSAGTANSGSSSELRN